MLQRSFGRIRWRYWLQPWQHIDWLLLATVVALCGLGGIMIRSTELNQGWTDWWQHWLMASIGLGMAMAIARFRYELLLQWKWWIFGITNVSLMIVMSPLGTSALGAQRWINVFGFFVQPSEFAKIGAIVTLAALLHERTASTLAAMLRALLITGVPWLLVFIQPDLGTSLVFGAVIIAMLYWGNAHWGWIVLMISPLVSAILFNLAFNPSIGQSSWMARVLMWGLVALWIGMMGFVGWRSLPWHWRGAVGALVVNLVSGELGHLVWEYGLKPYQRARITLFLDPDQDPLGGGYHLIQSRIAIGAGQLFGRGLNQGTQTQLNFIPEQHTDFIFSAIGEELGFVGSLLVLLAFWFICLRIILIAQNARDNFGSLIAVGVFAMLIFQVVVNIGMTIGLGPVTGIPLPWVSYGRSAMLTNFIALGLVESVANFRTSRIRS
jgi:rod shape determining protein RodA